MELAGQPHAPPTLSPWKRAPGTNWVRGLVDPRVSVATVVEK